MRRKTSHAQIRPTRPGCYLIANLILIGSASWGLHAQSLLITPARVLSDQPAEIRATGLQPNQRITLKADLVDGNGHPWASENEFVADPQGALDLSTQAPLSGSYKVASAMGPLWSMRPAAKDVEIYRPPQNSAPQQIRFELLRSGQTIATAQLEQDAMAEGVHRIELTGHLSGTLFLPAGAAPHPGILVLGGSEGGLPGRRAAWLASHGYAALALAYFRYQNLPAKLEAIPLEYFARALAWMLTRPEISPGKIAVMGVSRGGELALQLASMFPQIKTVVAYVPANVRHGACCGDNLVPYAWTWKNQPLAFVRRNNERGPDAFTAAIHVEDTSGPILLIAGQDDHVWDSAPMAAAIVARLKQAHFKYPVENLTYPHAGHIAGRPEIIPAWHGLLRHPVSGRPTDYGGTPEGNALSSLDAIPKVLNFLRKNLENETDK